MPEIEEVLEDLGCDPLKLSAKLAMGKRINIPHKDLPKIKSKWDSMLCNLQKGEIKSDNLKELWQLIESALTASRPSKEIQSKHIISLTEYLYSKRKSVETISKVQYFEKMADVPDELLEKIAMGQDVDIVIGDDDDSITSA